MSDKIYITSHGEQSILKIYVQPGASKSEIVGAYGDPPRLKIRVRGIPEDGKANSELLAFLAKILGLSKSKIKLVRGEASRQKDLLVNLNAPILADALCRISQATKAD